MTKFAPKLHVISELNDINQQIIPLKALADRERLSIQGLSGLIYTPLIDEYMQVSIKKAAIMVCLKKQKILPETEVELISAELEYLYKRVKNNTVVEHKGHCYQRKFSPLKLSKSGKIVQKWAKYWFLQRPNEEIDPDWEAQVREIWPSYFLISTVDY